MGGWIGARVRAALGIDDAVLKLMRELEATKLRVKVLEGDVADTCEQADKLDDRLAAIEHLLVYPVGKNWRVDG